MLSSGVHTSVAGAGSLSSLSSSSNTEIQTREEALSKLKQYEEVADSRDADPEAVRKAYEQKIELLHNLRNRCFLPETEIDHELSKAYQAQSLFEREQSYTVKAEELDALARSFAGYANLDQKAKPASSTSHQRPATLSIQTKGELVDYLFERMLSALGALKVAAIPNLFLVYAHDNSAQGQADANTSKYLISKLAQIRVLNLYSDQTPLGQQRTVKQDGQLADILTSQLCLLPDKLRGDIEPVDKVVVCCSEVLGNYLKGWPHYNDFYQGLREAYKKDLEQKGTSEIRKVVDEFSQKGGFHHVFTEIAFLQIRVERRVKPQHPIEELTDQQHDTKDSIDRHGIIPVPLTPNSYEQCFAHFAPTIPITTVRVGDIYRCERQAKAGKEVYPNQGRHGALFKLIERLLFGNAEAKVFLDKFWKGYDDLLTWLERESSTSPLERRELKLISLIDGIFEDIEKELKTRLCDTVQQFCDSGWQQATVQLIDQLQKLFPLCMKNAEALQKLFPLRFSSNELREALHQYYQPTLNIKRISGKTLNLEHCYINLAIVEEAQQRQEEKQKLEKSSVVFNRLLSYEKIEGTNLHAPILLEDLFNKRVLCDGKEGIPKRILVQGRAGIGKTTLCKKLVHAYHQNGLWKDRFEAVLWLPLRQLKSNYTARNLEDLLCEKYFAQHLDKRALALALIERKDKVLFILDGLDEVSTEINKTTPLGEFLNILLSQSHVVMTSRPSGLEVSNLQNVDLELETIGFSTENVQAYLEKIEPKAAPEIQAFIENTSLIQGLVNIPVQLDVLCYSWDILLSRMSANNAITMGMLYQAMVDKLWHKDGERLEKIQDGKLLEWNDIEALSRKEVEEQLVFTENMYLSYLAFRGLQDARIEFDLSYLNTLKDELNKKCVNKLPLQLKNNLTQTSFLHTVDAHLAEIRRAYHFLHLTFQEFFAAKWLVYHLEAYWNHAVPISDTTLILSQIETENFIQQNKYNPRYEIVWWIVAGLLRGASLERFFMLLEEAPRDLIGLRHQRVIAGCLNEARDQLKKKIINQLEAELMQWLRLEIDSESNSVSQLGCQRFFPEHLLLEYLSLPDGKPNIISTLGARQTLSDRAISTLVATLQDKKEDIRSAASRALSKQQTLSAHAISALITVLQNKNENIRVAVIRIFGEQKTLASEAISALIVALQDEEENEAVRFAAANALGEQKKLSSDAISALIVALQNEDESEDVRYAAACALGKQKTVFNDAISALIAALQDKDENEDIRSVAVQALGEWKILPADDIPAQINALRNKDKYIRDKATQRLCEQKTLPTDAIFTLIDLLQDEVKEFQHAAGKVLLRQQKTFPAEAITTLINVLYDQEEYVRVVAGKILREQQTLPASAVSILNIALQDENEDIKFAAAQILHKQKTLSNNVISTLITALRGKNKDVRLAAIKALSSHIDTLYTLLPSLKENEIQALYNDVFLSLGGQITALYLQDNNLHFYTMAGPKSVSVATEQVDRVIQTFTALQRKTQITTLPEKAEQIEKDQSESRENIIQTLEPSSTQDDPTISDLVSKLSDDNNKDVRSTAVHALGAQTALPETAIQALIQALQDEYNEVRSAAVSALSAQKTTLSEAANWALLQALENKKWYVRDMAARVFGAQITLKKSAISALTQTLKDENCLVRFAAATALGTETTLPEPIIEALIKALEEDEDSNVKSAAASSLSAQTVLPETAIKALFQTLHDKNSLVRAAAASALGAQASRSETIIEDLIQTLQNDEKWYVKSAAVNALGAQLTLPETAIEALIQALQNWSPQVRSAAASALGVQTTLTETTIEVLIQVLQNTNSDIRSSVTSVLDAQAKRSEAVVGALIQALQNTNSDVRSSAASVLGALPTLAETVIEALIQVLQNTNNDVRSSVVSVLGAHAKRSETVVEALVQALMQNANSDTKSAAASALSSQSTLPEAAIEALVQALQNGDSQVKSAVVIALGSQTTLTEAVIEVLFQALQDEDLQVRSEATSALRTHSLKSQAVVDALIQTLQNANSDIRSAAISALDTTPWQPETIIEALLQALQDGDSQVRSAAAKALDAQARRSASVFDTLIHALQNENSQVRSAVADVLGAQPTLPYRATEFLLHTMRYATNSDIRSAAASVLGIHIQVKRSDTAILAMIGTLKDTNSEIRSEAANALGAQPMLPELAIMVLTDALQDRRNSQVRSAAVSALCAQAILSKTVVKILIQLLQHRSSDIKSAAISVLGAHAKRSEAVVEALIQALQNTNADIRSSAASLLSEQILSETAVGALVQILQATNSDARSAAVSVLVSQTVLSETAIKALVQVLQGEDEDRSVKFAAANALGSHQITMLDPSVQALLNGELSTKSETQCVIL